MLFGNFSKCLVDGGLKLARSIRWGLKFGEINKLACGETGGRINREARSFGGGERERYTNKKMAAWPAEGLVD
jgi:hypothetical protein